MLCELPIIMKLKMVEPGLELETNGSQPRGSFSFISGKKRETVVEENIKEIYSLYKTVLQTSKSSHILMSIEGIKETSLK